REHATTISVSSELDGTQRTERGMKLVLYGYQFELEKLEGKIENEDYRNKKILTVSEVNDE
ncbi:unnamed protein product, partial [Dovyalis caffra]